jgi:hypothetical protein
LGGHSESGADGDKNEASQGDKDYWAIKLDSDPAFVTIESNRNEGMLLNQFIILPAFPNPFNPTTTISYRLDKDTDVSVNIYDISGKLISTLKNKNQTQGWHSIIWNGIDNSGNQVGGGVYFYQVKAGSFVETKKMLLLK